jgi:hypothetical protein
VVAGSLAGVRVVRHLRAPLSIPLT